MLHVYARAKALKLFGYVLISCGCVLLMMPDGTH